VPPDLGDEKSAMTAPADFQPGEGVPVIDFGPGKTPARWLAAGPIAFKVHIDQVESVLQNGRRRPAAGDAVSFGTLVGGRPEMVSVAFKALPAEAAGEAGVDLAKLVPAAGPSTIFLFAALKVDREVTVGLAKGHPDTTVWLAGSRLEEGASYRLAPGLYPLLVAHATAKSSGVVAPRFDLPGSGALAFQRIGRDLAMATWQQDHRIWEEGGADPVKMRLFDVGYQQVYQHYRLGIGDGGFQAETGSYADIASSYPLVSAAMYRPMFGRQPSGYPDVAYLLPRRMMQVWFPPAGKPYAHKINSAAGFRVDWCAAAFPIVPDRYKPGLLWAWNRVCGVTGKADAARVLEKAEGLHLADAFVNYPLDMEPGDPAAVMPRSWQAPTFGYHCFRSGWEGRDEFISQVFVKASLIKGWNHPNAGTLRVFGFGRPWVAGSYDRVGFRVQEPVLVLPEDEHNEGACGRLAALDTAADGSACISIDLRDVYAGKASLFDRNLVPRPERFADSGISGLRALAFDYGRASGAPCLVAVVDKIAGGKSRLWLWPLPEGALEKVKVEGNTFTIDYGDASMKATFVSPRGVRVQAASEEVALGDLANAHASFQGRLDRIKAGGEGDFFVVATFQRGPAPAVKVEGQGLDATVTVGRQTVRFDGRKVVLGAFGGAAGGSAP